MDRAKFDCANEDKVNAHAAKMAAAMGRGTANIEDQLSAALSLLSGLQILEHADVAAWETAIDKVLGSFIKDVLATEKSIRDGLDKAPASGGPLAREILVSFLMSFASRAASRERLQIFTTNYDRLIERGCDLAGLRIVDRFVGAIEPEFRSSRLRVDMHYTPPGIRGDALGGLLGELPTLPSQQAILLGWAVPTPVLVRIRDLPQRPRSADPAFWATWLHQRGGMPDWEALAPSWEGTADETSPAPEAEVAPPAEE